MFVSRVVGNDFILYYMQGHGNIIKSLFIVLTCIFISTVVVLPLHKHCENSFSTSMCPNVKVKKLVIFNGVTEIFQLP